VRRTFALHDKLARDMKFDRLGLAAERARHRADAVEAFWQSAE
jgi:hypothetical protein